MSEALEAVGKEFEARPYHELLQPAEVLSFSREFDGVTLHFSAEASEVAQDGTLRFCIDVSGLPTRTFWKPSYVFEKRKLG